MLIVFDGIDGAGKSTHLKLISIWLKEKRYSFISRREPGGTYIAEQMRKILINSKQDDLMQLMLVSLARLSNTQSLENHEGLILFDRFSDSTYAYQKNIDKEVIDYMVNLTSKIKADFTFLFLNQYRQNVKNHLDEFSDTHYEQIKNTYIERSKIEPEKYCIVQDDTKENQLEFIKNKIKQLINDNSKLINIK